MDGQNETSSYDDGRSRLTLGEVQSGMASPKEGTILTEAKVSAGDDNTTWLWRNCRHHMMQFHPMEIRFPSVRRKNDKFRKGQQTAGEDGNRYTQGIP